MCGCRHRGPSAQMPGGARMTVPWLGAHMPPWPDAQAPPPRTGTQRRRGLARGCRATDLARMDATRGQARGRLGRGPARRSLPVLHRVSSHLAGVCVCEHSALPLPCLPPCPGAQNQHPAALDTSLTCQCHCIVVLCCATQPGCCSSHLPGNDLHSLVPM